jgi:hypothetical protein
MAAPDPVAHHWYTPAECAALLGGEAHGEKWRAPCPAHGGSNPTALGIAQGRDRDGNPMTLLHCFANQCPIEDICAAMGIEVKALFCIHPTYARATRHLPRTRSPRIAQIKRRTDQLTPLTPDEMAQVMLEEMIVSDPQWIQDCAPARAKMWELAVASPAARLQLYRALRTAALDPSAFFDTLREECGGQTCH